MRFHKKKLLFLLVLFSFVSGILNAQHIPNLSFEGRPGESVSPPDWSPCNLYSTPDTQPGSWNVTTAASDGNTYLGLVTRGNLGPYANHTEAVGTKLLNPFETGKEYTYTLDLALSESHGHFIGWSDEFLLYDKAVMLRIYGGSGPCEKAELLWESPAIDHTHWKPYDMVLKPKDRDVFYIILEASYVGSTTYFGNILVDNFRECFVDLFVEPEVIICEGESHLIDLTIPNGQYLWSDGYRSPQRQVFTTAFYSVEVSNHCAEATYEVNVISRNCNCDTAFPINFKSFDTLLCKDEPFMLNVQTPGGSYKWEDGSIMPQREVQTEGNYTVEISNGCETEYFGFYVGFKDCICDLQAPNVFTPNGDNFNETFLLRGSANIGKFSIKVFNRWGSIVYQSDRQNEEWNGKFNGEPVSPGVYYWIADIACILGNSITEKQIKGHVTLLR